MVWLLDQPHGTGLLGLAAFARLGPRVLFGAAGGVMADRYDRRKLIVGLDFARAALMVLLCAIAGSATPADGAARRARDLHARNPVSPGRDRRHPARGGRDRRRGRQRARRGRAAGRDVPRPAARGRGPLARVALVGVRVQCDHVRVVGAALPAGHAARWSAARRTPPRERARRVGRGSRCARDCRR